MSAKTIKALRVTGVEAAALLGCSTSTIWELSKKEIFTHLHPNGRGIGKRCYYLRDEIELYALTGSRELVAQYRRKHKRS